MAAIRKISKVFKARPTLEGAGVHLKRVFANSETALFDPFLLLDDFRNSVPSQYLKGFPWHPHRGIETITYVLRGDVQHGDSMGNRGIISSGDIQWMTAGNGIIHEEMPKGDANGAMEGFQLWANLPASHKMMGPRYRDVKSGQVPEVQTKQGVRIRIICGRVGDMEGPVRDIVIEPQYLDVTVPAGATFSHSTVRGHTIFAYVIDGKGLFCDESDPFAYDLRGVNYFDLKRDRFITDGTALLFGDGDSVTATAEEGQLRFLLVSGKPIHEPIAWYGPIVMNTYDELRTAFDELDKGTFIKQTAG
jgi:quercetin 2,3-dioxygenase